MCGCVYWLLNVTINDISVIHVMAHRCAGGLKKIWTYGRVTDFSEGYLTCPSKHRHGVTLLTVYFENVPFHSPFTTPWRYVRPLLIFIPRVLSQCSDAFYYNIELLRQCLLRHSFTPTFLKLRHFILRKVLLRQF